MSFCASCGRQRNGTARFCGACGAEFTDAPAAPDNREPGPPDAAQADPAGGVTRMDTVPGAARSEPPAAQPDPFASWYQQGPQGTGSQAENDWQPTQTVSGTPTQATGYPPPGFTAANPFSGASPVTPPMPPAPPAGPPGHGGRRGLFIVLAVIVVLAAGGGAYALASTFGRHSAARQPAPTASVSSPAAGSSSPGTTQPTGSPATSASASPAPSPALSLVAISPGVTASAAQPQVETLLSHYFHGINTHNYAEYASTLNPAQQAKQSKANFDSGYSSTSDSGMTLTSLTDSGNGGLTATVTFTSRQSPAQSIDKSACNAWTLNLYLVPHGTGYLIGPAPSGYQPAYSDC